MKINSKANILEGEELILYFLRFLGNSTYTEYF